MEMGRLGDPFSEELIGFVVDRDRIWGVWLALLRGDDSAADPIMDDPQADAIPLSYLTDVEGVIGRPWSRDAMFVSQPFYCAQRELLSGRTLLAFGAHLGDDLVVMMADCQLSNARHECLGVEDRFSPVLRKV